MEQGNEVTIETEKAKSMKKLKKRGAYSPSVVRGVGRILHLDKYLIVIFPIVISMDTKLHTVPVFLEM